MRMSHSMVCLGKAREVSQPALAPVEKVDPFARWPISLPHCEECREVCAGKKALINHKRKHKRKHDKAKVKPRYEGAETR